MSCSANIDGVSFNNNDPNLDCLENPNPIQLQTNYKQNLLLNIIVDNDNASEEDKPEAYDDSDSYSNSSLSCLSSDEYNEESCHNKQVNLIIHFWMLDTSEKACFWHFYT